jgi:transcriptional regulator with XRE-family HTH domain
MKLGTVLKGARQAKRLSRDDVVEKLGLSYQSLLRYENNKNKPCLDHLVQLAKLYDLSLDDLFLSQEVTKV